MAILSKEWYQKPVFAVLLKFMSLVNEDAPKGQLLQLFPQFKSCVNALFSDGDTKQELYEPRSRIAFGRLVDILCKHLSDRTNDHELRADCAQMLKIIVKSNESTSNAGSVAYVLPGVAMTCIKVVKTETHSRFCGMSLSILHEIFLSTLNDKLITKLRSTPDLEPDQERFALRRDEKWIQETAERVLKLIEDCISVTTQSESEVVRLKLLNLVSDCTKQCNAALGERILFSLMQLMALRHINESVFDRHHELHIKQTKVLIDSVLSNILHKQANLEDSFRMLPKYMKMLLLPYAMKYVAKKHRETSNFFRRLRRALVNNIEIDLPKIVPCEKDSDPFSVIPLKDPVNSETLKDICSTLTNRHIVGKQLFRCFSNAMRTGAKDSRLNATLIICHLCSEISKSCGSYSNDNMERLMRKEVTYWIKCLDKFANLEPEPNNATPAGSSSSCNTRESVEACALLLSIGFAMQTMHTDRRFYQRLLVDVLYVLLQFLPSTNLICASAAQFALDGIIRKHRTNPEVFMANNADKVVFKLALMTRNLHKNPRSPFALAALLDRGYGQKMTNDLVNLIPELLSGINTEDNMRIVPCLKAMISFIRAVTEWFPDLRIDKVEVNEMEAKETIRDDSSSDEEDENPQDVGGNWDRLEKIREKFEKLRAEKESELMNCQQVPSDEKEPPPPLISCVEKILQRVQHLHHSVHPYTRILLADLLCAGFRFIRNFDDQLLPMIHQNWLPMSISMRRTFNQAKTNITAPDKLIVAAELRVVLCMCEVSKSFVYQKILQDLDEPLHNYMLKVFNQSQQTSAVYTQSSGYKLQATIMECGVPKKNVHQILHKYANDTRQNPNLRQLASDDKQQIQESSRSFLWFTYRTNFPAIGGDGPTSDKGWGCMLRCGQMLLAHALTIVHLGRDWQWSPGSTNRKYRNLLRMFQDKRKSLYSLQQIAQMGVNEGRQLCEWFGPNTISQCLKKLVIYDDWSKIGVHVAMDNVLFASDVRQLAATSFEDVTEPDHDKRLKLDSNAVEKPWRPILILVPLRLGLNSINREYLKPIQEFFKLPQCCGILGGRPNHAVFFTGYSGEELFYLDPHTAQMTVDLDPPLKSSSSLDFEVAQEVQDEKNVILVEEQDGQFGNAQTIESLGSNGDNDVDEFDDLKTDELDQQTVEACEPNGKLIEELPDDESEEVGAFDDSSFHCSELQYMYFDSLDPSLALGFLCACEDDFNDLIIALKDKVLPASKAPIFELMDQRPSYYPPYVPYTRAAQSTCSEKDYEDFADPQFDSDEEFEVLEPTKPTG
ncbi:Cysteine protease [Aphelenchoides besseyi]|nr:Cysteine protease [Aphelenchoides besseyi]